MPTTVNRAAYVQLIDEDCAWLQRQPRTLERDHIEQVLMWSIRVLYDGEPGDAFGDPAREVERLRVVAKAAEKAAPHLHSLADQAVMMNLRALQSVNPGTDALVAWQELMGALAALTPPAPEERKA